MTDLEIAEMVESIVDESVFFDCTRGELRDLVIGNLEYAIKRWQSPGMVFAAFTIAHELVKMQEENKS